MSLEYSDQPLLRHVENIYKPCGSGSYDERVKVERVDAPCEGEELFDRLSRFLYYQLQAAEM